MEVNFSIEEELEIILIKRFDVESHITNERTPEIGETLKTRLEPENAVDRFAVTVEKEGLIVGHLNKGNIGRFAKTVLFPSCEPRKYLSSWSSREKSELTEAATRGVLSKKVFLEISVKFLRATFYIEHLWWLLLSKKKKHFLNKTFLPLSQILRTFGIATILLRII